jgi:hypothetical protein
MTKMGVEADIVWALKEELSLDVPRLHSWRIDAIGVDSDGSYRNSRYASQLEPLISVPIRGFYPDLVCSYDSPAESGIAAFDLKVLSSCGGRFTTEQTTAIDKGILTQINTELTMALSNEEVRRFAVRNASADITGFERELQVVGKGHAFATASYRDIRMPTQAPHFDKN